MKNSKVIPNGHLVFGVTALLLAREEADRLLKIPSPAQSLEERTRLQSVKDRLDAAIIVLEQMHSLAHSSAVAIGAYQFGELDETLDRVNQLNYRAVVEPFRVDTHA